MSGHTAPSTVCSTDADTPMVLRPVPGSKRNIPDHLIVSEPHLCHAASYTLVDC
jgi:hypothetical protein